MPTVNKDIAYKVILGNGMYPGDHMRVVRVTEYDNMFGGVSYGLDYEGWGHAYGPSPYVQDPRIIWEYKP
jgi:hypothetical protein